MQKKKNKKIKKRSLKFILIVLIVLLVVLSFFLFLQFSEKTPWENFSKKPKLIVIEDECSLIFNRIIHEIKNSGECRIACINECRIRGEEIYNSKFIESNDSCNTCNCYCK